MPSTKQFEAVDINELIFGTGKSKWLNMYEISKIYYEHIEQAFKFLEEGKIVSMEVPADERFYYLKKINSDSFTLQALGKDPFEKKELKAIETVNWLFEKAPFISMVGYSNI
jgi:hypothetical protein